MNKTRSGQEDSEASDNMTPALRGALTGYPINSPIYLIYYKEVGLQCD